MNTRSFSIMQAIDFGFRMFARNIWFLLGLSLAGAAVQFGAIVLSGVIIAQSGLSTCLKLEESSVVEKSESGDMIIHYNGGLYKGIVGCFTKENILPIMLIVLIFLLAAVFSFVLIMGWNRIALDLYDNGTSQFNRIFVTFPLFFTFLIAGFIYSFVASITYLLLVIPEMLWGKGGMFFGLLTIPGIIWLIKYGFFDLIIVDTECGPMEALSKSGELTYGNKWQLFLFGLIGFVFLHASAFTIIGPFILMYVLWLSRAYIYRTLQGKKSHA